MKKILNLIEEKMRTAFETCGYEASYARIVLSNRPDLCEYQCNGAMAAAKAYKKKPIDIATAVVENLTGDEMFSEIHQHPFKSAVPCRLPWRYAERRKTGS